MSIRAAGIMNERTAEELLGGGSAYSDYITATYYKNLLSNTERTSPVAYKICSTFETHDALLEGISWPVSKGKGKSKKTAYTPMVRPPANAVKQEDWDALHKYFDDKIAQYTENVPTQHPAYHNIDRLGENLSFTKLEVDILKFLYATSSIYTFSPFVDTFIEEDATRVSAAIARFLGIPKDVRQINKILGPSSSFNKYGIIYGMGDEDTKGVLSPLPKIEDDILDFIRYSEDEDKSIAEVMIGKPVTAALDTDDFSSLSDDINQILSIIKGSVEKQKEGVNILLYGPAGSGKTELAKALAKKINIDIYAVGEDPEDNGYESYGESAAKKRVTKLFQAHAFLQGKKVVLLFDEVEDMLIKGTDSDKKAEPPSKIVVNRLLENNPVVTIWAGNDPDKFHESMRQRFTYSLYVDYPPTEMRKKIWQKQLEINRAQMAEKEVTQLARRYLAPGRMIAKALEHAGHEPETATIERFLHASSRLTYGDIEAIESGAGLSDKFDLDLINYDAAHQNEMGAIIADGKKARPYAILAQGEAGSGLRSFGRFMAEKTVINHAEYDVRALLAPNPLSSPEANIKGAFDAARNRRQLLVFSHMDAFASEPANDSSPDWRGGLTALFMECLMNHSMPVIAHTYNTKAAFPEFMNDCFSMRLNVSPLTPEQSARAMKAYFPHIEADSDKKPEFPSGLVPADFARVAKILQRSTNGHSSATKVVEMLGKQPAYRLETGGKMGFNAR